MCKARGVPLLINDRVDVALAVGADGVHVGQVGSLLTRVWCQFCSCVAVHGPWMTGLVRRWR